MAVPFLRNTRSTRYGSLSDDVIAAIAAQVTAAQRTISLVAGENIALGDLITIEGGQWYKASQLEAGNRFRVMAVAEAAITAGNPGNGAVVHGAPYPTRFTVAPLAASNGVDVYLGTSGEATLTPPPTHGPGSFGKVVAKVGYLVDGDGATLTPKILFYPQPTLTLH